MNSDDSIRSMTVDYIFYPGEKEKLEANIKYLLEVGRTTKGGSFNKVPDNIRTLPVRAIISPHAAWSSCGAIMGKAFAAAADRNISTVVILSRVHREPSKTVFLPKFSRYSTPLGDLEVDEIILKALAETDRVFEFNNIPHIEEHSIEVQLPFIKYLWPEAKIVPVLTGKSSLSMANKLSLALGKTINNKLESAIIIVSSSFSAYGAQMKSKEETDLFLSLIMDHEGAESMPEKLNKGEIGACSADCVSAVLKFLISPEKIEKIDILDVDYGESLDSLEKRVCFGAVSIR